MCTFKPLDSAEYTTLYVHYEERWAEIRGQMISTITILYTVIVPLIGILGSWMFDLSDDVKHSVALAVAFIGLLLSVLSLFFVLDFKKHMRRSAAMSKRTLLACHGLKDDIEALRAASLGKTLDDYRTEAKHRNETVWLNPKLWVKVESIFLITSIGATAWFLIGAYWAYFT
jgi:hypothetical protein